MGIKLLIFFFTLLSLITPEVSCAANDKKLAAQAIAMTPQQFQSTAVIKDDNLDTTAQIDTSKGFQAKRGLLKILWNDNFLRAFIDKKTGATTIQVYEFIMYEGNWRYYNTVNYETPTGPRSEAVKNIARNVVSCSGSRYGNGCMLSEHMAFDVDESLLRTIASKYTQGTLSAWKFKFGAQRAEDWNSGIFPAEVAGFLAVIDDYRTKHGLAANSSTPEIAKNAVLKSDKKSQQDMNSDLRRLAKEAIDRSDMKAAKEYLDMIIETK